MTTITQHHRNNGQRIPPHDIDAERALLGAMMLDRDARTQALERIHPDDFYRPQHTDVFQAITALTDRDHGIDATIVAAELADRDHLERVGGRDEILKIYAAGYTMNVGGYIDIVHRAAQARRTIALAGALAEAAYTNEPIAGALTELHDLAITETMEETSSWVLVDLTPSITGTDDRPIPAMLARTDGVELLYPGRLHAFNAEPEAGKSWLALLACVECMRFGQHVLYIDFEDDAAGIVERLLALGASAPSILELFHYVRPDDPIDAHARLAITTMVRERAPTLAIVDGVAEAMASTGWDENSNSEVAAFYNALPRLLSRTHGVTTVVIDHVVKDPRERGRGGRGGGHKLAGLDGAAFALQLVVPFGRNKAGMTKVILEKDRGGWLRQHPKTLAEMHVHSRNDGAEVTIELRPPKTASDTDEDDKPRRPTVLMERVSRALEDAPEELTGYAVANTLPANVDGRKARRQDIYRAIAVLLEEGYLARQPGHRKGSWQYRSTRPYRQADDPHGPDHDLHHNDDPGPDEPTELDFDEPF